MKDLITIVAFIVLFTITVYERLTYGVASAYFIFPVLFLFPLVIMSSKDILNRYKKKLNNS